LTAITIAVTAIERLLHPHALSGVGIGLAISVAASLINLSLGLVLVRAGREHRSINLEADGKHLLTDVWTSLGVVVGVATVAIFGRERLDAIVALAVAVNIVFTDAVLLRRSATGLMDRALPDEVQGEIRDALAEFDARAIEFHALRTRQAGQRAFISLHILVPGAWAVQQGHDVAEEVESALRRRLPYATVFTQVEPDQRSFDDTTLDPRVGRTIGPHLAANAPATSAPRPLVRPHTQLASCVQHGVQLCRTPRWPSQRGPES
jgi:cation diffusion facilitator family transporter